MRLLLAFLLILAACSPALPRITEPDRAWARQAFPESQDDLDNARALYAGKCGGCHRLVLPLHVRQAEWPRVVETMAERAKLRSTDRARILRYLLTASRPEQPPVP